MVEGGAAKLQRCEEMGRSRCSRGRFHLHSIEVMFFFFCVSVYVHESICILMLCSE